MEQSATAPAIPAANGKGARALLRASLYGLGFHAALLTAQADTLPFAEDAPLVIAEISFTRTASLDRAPVDFHFMPRPSAKTVVLHKVRLEPVAQPAVKPKSLVPIDAHNSASTLPDRRSHRVTPNLKSTILFGTMGKSVPLTPVSKRWTRALGEFEAATATGSRHNDRAYSAILAQVKDFRRGLQIPKINYMVNRVLAYRDDARVWKTGEYWASPSEALEKRAGDCEDYAILKYALLRDLGVQDEDMRIVVLMDEAAGQHHAVLSVRHDGQWLILDNRFSRIRFERDLPNYKPLYSVNASGQWSHTLQKGAPVSLAARLKSANK